MWDFETEPEFQEKLDWVEAFVREEVEPLDVLFPELVFTPLSDELRKIVDPLKQRVRDAGLWACHLGPELGGAGLRPAEALADERDPRPLPVGAGGVRVPGARHRQRRDHRPLRHRGAEGEVPPAAAERRVLLVLLDDRAAGRRRPDPVRDPGRPRRRRVGAQRLEVLLVERQDRRVPDRDGGHRPRRLRLPGDVDVPGADRHARREHRAQPRPRQRAGRARQPRADPLRGRAPPARRRCSAARARPSPSPRPASAAGASTTPCAPSGCARRPST